MKWRSSRKIKNRQECSDWRNFDNRMTFKRYFGNEMLPLYRLESIPSIQANANNRTDTTLVHSKVKKHVDWTRQCRKQFRIQPDEILSGEYSGKLTLIDSRSYQVKWSRWLTYGKARKIYAGLTVVAKASNSGSRSIHCGGENRGQVEPHSFADDNRDCELALLSGL